ncbi:hypothetical protein AB0H83_38205 [Dactylosporangium sp. NPDC050688]|uniref:hypothetical protein n=1 Tax=Dactylosporangium sp. NPDC050688 TaxID=3157217 RepID=UPI0033EF2584
MAPSLWTFTAALVPIAAAAAVVGALAGIAGAPVLGLLCETIGARDALVLAGTAGVLTCTGAALWFKAAAAATADAAAPVPA